MEVNVSFCTLVVLALVSMICGAESVYRRINTAHRASGLVKPENWSSRDLIYLWGPLTSVFTHGVMSCRMQLKMPEWCWSSVCGSYETSICLGKGSKGINMCQFSVWPFSNPASSPATFFTPDE